MVTNSSTLFLDALAMMFANLDFLLKFLRENFPEYLFIGISDHGGDESPYSQELYSHNQNNSPWNNEAFLMFFNKDLKKESYSNKYIYVD